MIGSKTLFKGSAASGLPIDIECPRCHEPTSGLPFCANDGYLVRRAFTVADRYVIEELLGAGGTALVYSGHDKQLGRPVAVKILRPQLLADDTEPRRFLRAAKLSSQLHHENIVVVHDAGEDPDLGIVFLVMERLIGETLADLLARDTRLPWQRVVRILVQVCRALDESHRRGILHRDLGPRNVTLITSSGRADVVKLCDFGLARTSAGEDRVTSTGTAVGTPAYMAPEQVRGDEVQDHRLDLYALGAIAYEMLSGRLPYESSTTIAMIASKLAEPAMPLSQRCPDLELPAGLEALVMRCLALEPSERPESAAAIERELLVLGDDDPSTQRADSELVGQRIGHYVVLQRINQGGMGEVYVAEHDVLGSKAALKVLLPEIASNPEATERFIQEARASSNIRSPHIPRCYDFGYLPGKRAYVLMELIEGESVAAQIQNRGRLPLAEVKQILEQAIEALAAAHDIGIIHRDIKPDHIMVCSHKRLEVKLLDFGIAKVSAGSATKTQVGVFMGTPMYCAPEQVLGASVSPATDIYALGATAYEMLTGRPPFSGEAGHVLAVKTQRDPAPVDELAPGVPRIVAASIARMMSRDPAKRPASMHALAAEVAQWPDVQARPVSAGWLAIVGLVACAVLALAIVLWPSGSESPRTVPPRPVARPTTVSPPIAPSNVSPPSVAPTVAPSPEPEAAPTPKRKATAPKAAHKKDTRDSAKPPRTNAGTTNASGSADVMIVDPF